jgi:outer membrane protein
MSRTTKIAALCLASAVGMGPVQADTIFGVHASAHLWRPDLSGTIGQTTDSFDLSAEFSERSADSESVMVAVEHFIPLLPNLMFRRTPVDWSAASVNATGTLGSISLSGDVSANIDLSATDATFYYELLDNWITADLGLSLRRLDGTASAAQRDGDSEVLSFSDTVPMLYGHARFDLPFTGLAAGARGNVTGDGSGEMVDIEAYLHLEVDLLPLIDVGIEGGVRRLAMEFEDLDSLNADATLNGAYIAITAHF